MMRSSTSSEGLRSTIGQNCSAVCTNKGGHRDTFSNEVQSTACFKRPAQISRPPSLERSER